MFHFCASCESCGANGLLVSVNQRSQSLLPGFIASGIQLLLRKRHTTALADRLRGEDFDHVRSGLFLLAYEGADFIRRAGSLALSLKRFDSRQDARAGKHALRDRVA